MGKRIAYFLSFSMFLSASPSFADSVTPSPSASPITISICAPINTGIPQKVNLAKCPHGMLALGTTAIVHGADRPTSINRQLRNRFVSARTAAAHLGLTIGIHSGWRSWDTQARLYQNALAKYKTARLASRWVLPPEKSMHVWGLAVDVQFGNFAAKKWFRENSYKYGICRRYKNEWWHYEPVIAPGDKCPAMKPFAK